MTTRDLQMFQRAESFSLIFLYFNFAIVLLHLPRTSLLLERKKDMFFYCMCFLALVLKGFVPCGYAAPQVEEQSGSLHLSLHVGHGPVAACCVTVCPLPFLPYSSRLPRWRSRAVSWTVTMTTRSMMPIWRIVGMTLSSSVMCLTREG